MVKYIRYSLITLLLIAYSCSEENQVRPQTFDPLNFDTLNLSYSMKGWELYSWPSMDTWNFALVPGTNRLKSYDEIMYSPYRVTGIATLKELLSCLPEGEEIIWIEEEWLNQIWVEPYQNLQLPPESIVIKVKLIAKELGLYMWVSNE